MQIRRHFLYLLSLVFVLSMCACFNSGGSAAEHNLPTRESNPILFQDDFSNPKSGWDRTSQGGNSTDYADGKYRITLATPQQDIWANPYQYFDQDIIVAVDAWQNTSTVQASYGIICGYNDVNNFYALTIGSGGYVEIFRYQQGKRITLFGAEDQAGIDPEHNHLEAMCTADQLSLWVNGNIVAEVEVTEFTYGDVGLIVSSFDEAGIEIDFDNFVVKAAGFSTEP